MKKTRIIAVMLAAVMLLSMIPMTAGAADARHPIVKDVVEFSGQYLSSDSYFALGNSLYNGDGDKIFTLGAEDEMIYTLTDHCMITLVSNVGDLSDQLESLEDPESLKNIKIDFNLYSINGDEVVLKSSFDNFPYVLPFEGYSYAAVLHCDIITLLMGIFGGEFDEEAAYDLIYGYDIIDEYGNVVYSQKGVKIAQPIGDGMFLVDLVSSEGETQNILTVTDKGIKEIEIGNGYLMVQGTELGHVMVMNEDLKYGVMNTSGELLIETEFDEIVVSDEYYIATEIHEVGYGVVRALVYDKNGKCVWECEDPITYYNGKIIVVETLDIVEEDGKKFGYGTMRLIDLATGEAIIDSEEIYCEGGYIFAEYATTQPYGGAEIYNTDGEYIGRQDAFVVCVDEGNSSVIFEDPDQKKTYRVTPGIELAESLSYDIYYESSYNNVSVAMNAADCETEDLYEFLVYKGEQITDDHDMFMDSFVVNGCEVYVFCDYDIESFDDAYVAYIIDDDKSPFYDVQEDHWAREYIDICFNAGIMNGTGGGKFSPSGAVSRAQVVTTLWRLAGEPAAEGENTFVDVADGTWYTDAVKWAAECGITSGVGGDYFAPDRTVTRGEVAAILYRYAEYAGDDVTAKADLSTFADADELSDWNRDAFAWCAAEGIITGKTAGESSPVRLAPSDALTRAEIAAVLCRYGV